MATEKQLKYLRDLMKGKGAQALKSIGMTMNERAGNFEHTPNEKISRYIDALKKMK